MMVNQAKMKAKVRPSLLKTSSCTLAYGPAI